MYQSLTLVGNVGSIETRYTPSGAAVTSMSIAVNRNWTDTQTGEKKTKTVWFRVTAWRKLAEVVGQYVEKGSQVLVVGEIEEARPYTDREGNAKASLEVTAQTVRFLGGKGSGKEAHADPTDGIGVDNAESIPF